MPILAEQVSWPEAFAIAALSASIAVMYVAHMYFESRKKKD